VEEIAVEHGSARMAVPVTLRGSPAAQRGASVVLVEVVLGAGEPPPAASGRVAWSVAEHRSSRPGARWLPGLKRFLRDDGAPEQHRHPLLHDRESIVLEERRVGVADVEDGNMPSRLEDAGNLAECLLALFRVVDVVERQAGDDDIERRVTEWDLACVAVADFDANAFQIRVAERGSGRVVDLVDVLPDVDPGCVAGAQPLLIFI